MLSHQLSTSDFNLTQSPRCCPSIRAHLPFREQFGQHLLGALHQLSSFSYSLERLSQVASSIRGTMKKGKICHWPQNESMVRVRHNLPWSWAWGSFYCPPSVPQPHTLLLLRSMTPALRSGRVCFAQLFHHDAVEMSLSLFTRHDFCNNELSVMGITSPEIIMLMFRVHNSRSAITASQEQIYLSQA